MEMSDIKQVQVHCGPGVVAYDFEDGVLEVWVGEEIKRAPKSAIRTEIVIPYRTWSMEETDG